MATYQMKFGSGQSKRIEADSHVIEGELLRFSKDGKIMETYMFAAFKEVLLNGAALQKTPPAGGTTTSSSMLS